MTYNNIVAIYIAINKNAYAIKTLILVMVLFAVVCYTSLCLLCPVHITISCMLFSRGHQLATYVHGTGARRLELALALEHASSARNRTRAWAYGGVFLLSTY